LTSRALKGLLQTNEVKPVETLKEADFNPTDLVQYTAKLGVVQELNSDRTIDAILSGTFGPTVVLVYAEWCAHCKNMMPAFEEAAKESKIPFVKVQGQYAPVTGRKQLIAGYPTILGVASVPPNGPPRRYGGMRSKEAFLEFATALHGSAPVAQPIVPPIAKELAYPPNIEQVAIKPVVHEMPKETIQVLPELLANDGPKIEILN
jgi:thiol-disulfide isomerase/thioredoxin